VSTESDKKMNFVIFKWSISLNAIIEADYVPSSLLEQF
jgi:hypothetical protein